MEVDLKTYARFMTDALKLRALRHEASASNYGGDSALRSFLAKVDADSTITDEVVRNLLGPPQEKEETTECVLCWRTATTTRLTETPEHPNKEHRPFCEHHARALDVITE